VGFRQHKKSSMTSIEEIAVNMVLSLEDTDSFLGFLIWLWLNLSISVSAEQIAVFTVWVTA